MNSMTAGLVAALPVTAFYTLMLHYITLHKYKNSILTLSLSPSIARTSDCTRRSTS